MKKFVLCMLFCVYADAAVQDGSTAGQPEADRPKKRVVYTTKKKKPAATQQDTEPVPGYPSLTVLILAVVCFCYGELCKRWAV